MSLIPLCEVKDRAQVLCIHLLSDSYRNRYQKGDVPLSIACYDGDTELARLLLERGATVTLANRVRNNGSG